ncbi:hypothetical protein NP493_959g00057 [Ridgeia piscesae]|uniref:Solute carrier family 23 member 2 n=1 Tax=Ridgeia piscesae TaxID=27915 RepID=A0AAD9KJN1_RIDPI|nr:hypothetical protein NP493_959g00057 [Ridgeia piscesae]
MPYNVTVNTTDTSLMSGVIEEAWRTRLRAISGALSLACAIETLIGVSGAIGYLTQYIGPLTVAPTIMMVTLSLFPAAVNACQHGWGIALSTVVLICIFSLATRNVLVPVPVLGSDRKVHIQRYPLCQLFALVLAMALSWLLCYILTVTDVFPNDPKSSSYMSRTDAKLDIIYKSRWLYIPYPGQWGLPTFNAGVFFGLLAIVFCSVMESVGDYYATAAVCRLPPPPKEAISRGIASEGFGCLIGALMGCSHATTSFSQTIGFVGMTRVASRYTWQLMGCMLMACAFLGKFGAVLTLMPEPIVGGMLIAGLGMVFSIGVSSAQHIDMAAPRNMFTLGVAIMLGICVPYWLEQNPDVVRTGAPQLDQVITMFLKTGMLLAGVIGFTLDLILPGAGTTRGRAAFMQSPVELSTSDIEDNLVEEKNNEERGRTNAIYAPINFRNYFRCITVYTKQG